MRSLSASIHVLSEPAAPASAGGSVKVVRPVTGSEPRRPITEPGGGGLPARKRVEQSLGRGPVEILVEIVVDLQDRRVDAGAQTLDLDQGEQAVGGGAADADAELALAGRDHLVRAAQPARRRRAGLQQIPPDRPQIEHRIKARDLVDADRRHPQEICAT